MWTICLRIFICCYLLKTVLCSYPVDLIALYNPLFSPHGHFQLFTLSCTCLAMAEFYIRLCENPLIQV